jgi:hypothetical protein
LGAAVLVGVAALLFSTCNSVPLTAPTNATITLYANTTIVPLNGTAQITATVIQSGGTVVHNGTEVTFSTSLGTIEPTTAETDDGKVTVTFRAGSQPGTATINAYSGAASTRGSAPSGTTSGTTSRYPPRKRFVRWRWRAVPTSGPRSSASAQPRLA